MRSLKQNLLRQLLTIAVLIILIILIVLCGLLPTVLLPLYEKNIYHFLNQPLQLIDNEIDDSEISQSIAFIYINKDTKIITSNNFNDIVESTPNQILDLIKLENGKFVYKNKTYYYSKYTDDYIVKIAITDNTYIEQIKKEFFYVLIPVLAGPLFLISIMLILWVSGLLTKIEYLKIKIDNISNENFKDKLKYRTDDELKVLSDTIDNMKISLKKQEEYKNQMYQNISHDFKTPLTVIKSYIEASEDSMIDKNEAHRVIKEQINKLELKVHSLLYLNKLNYIKENENYTHEFVDIIPILNESLEKFKYHRLDLKWEVLINDKKTIYRGTLDMWEAIIDNLFNNFIRYADSLIKITIKNNRIVFYNDGPNIDEKVFDDLFTPYKKGINGQFGLGLSIIKKTIALADYEISVKNEKKGVSFMIK
ncbi:MAG: histidine kinase dimerization/phospho-acceptor domain-containing protein [Bacilli bacterium]